MNPIHLTFASTFPVNHGNFTLDRLFDLLDKFDTHKRQEVLEAAYFSFETGSHNRENYLEEWYEDFKRVFQTHAQQCLKDCFAVYGLISYVLARALQKQDIGRFAQLIKRHQDIMLDSKELIEKKEWWESNDEKSTYIDKPNRAASSKSKIIELHKEIEYCKRVYDTFCEEVVKPMLDCMKSPKS